MYNPFIRKGCSTSIFKFLGKEGGGGRADVAKTISSDIVKIFTDSENNRDNIYDKEILLLH